GWLQNNGSWYYLNANGSMATDWVKDGDTWYYLEASGAMKASQWFKVSDKWYYVNGSGALAVNTTVDSYRVNANGEWVN
ncbi:TPA: choline-binding protein, partial [Streptococcus pneumoniae]|nr:choline-binding protein [Streptococcus pneumoniae]HET1794633.1 choline-binding protein [Streptococcus pneumoniae]HET2632046.1 choline-binding protein [Streptococcus pneumoniae]HET4512754.1 choline-binding protein [Streptococcus pneumoniae]HET4969064.1 choline-binding protein [Streptococcus pneumoniae]